jgi:hypothetical protein
MKTTLLYSTNSENQAAVAEFERRYFQETGKEILKYDKDTVDGAAIAVLYDILRFPSLFITTDDGTLIQLWDTELPQLSEVLYLERSI